MKKIVMTMGAFFALSIASAQGGYASFSVGYAGGTSNEVIGMETDVTTLTTFTQKNILGTFGSGIPISLSGGYMFSEHLGLELGLNYFIGSEVTSDKTTTFYGDKSTTTSKGSQVRILPQLVLSTGTENTLEVYGKSGFVLPVGGSTNFKVDAISSAKQVVVEGNSTGSFSFGYTGTVGAAFGLSDKLSIFGELQYIGLRIKNDSQTITSYTYDGIDRFSITDENHPLFLNKDDIETVYVDELNQLSNTDSKKPNEELRGTTNYNSLGINLGIKFNF